MFFCIVKGNIKVRKSLEFICLTVIFLHHKNLGFEKGCVDFIYLSRKNYIHMQNYASQEVNTAMLLKAMEAGVKVVR